MEGTDLPVVKLRNVRYNLCVDSLSGGLNNTGVITKGCNTGDYQLWELHRNGSYYILKSWGRWTHNSVHMCIYFDGVHAPTLESCAGTTSQQNWTRKVS